MLHALEEETGRSFHFTGSEGLPLDHFAIVEEGARAEIEEQSVPFREGEEVHVDIVEPHMYSEDDAVAKVDGYLIEVADGIPYVGEKMLVRIEQAGPHGGARGARRGRRGRGRGDRGAAQGARARGQARRVGAAAAGAQQPRKPATVEDEAVEALAEDDRVGARRHGAGGGRRGRRGRGAAAGPRGGRGRRPKPAADAEPPRQTGGRAGRRRGPGRTTTARYNRSLGAAAAEADGAVRVRTPKSHPKPASRCPKPLTQ